jgi:hypothetical protein
VTGTFNDDSRRSATSDGDHEGKLADDGRPVVTGVTTMAMILEGDIQRLIHIVHRGDGKICNVQAS